MITCAQSLYALRVLRHHGLGEAGTLFTIGRTTVFWRTPVRPPYDMRGYSRCTSYVRRPCAGRKFGRKSTTPTEMSYDLWSSDSFQGDRCVSADVRSVSVDWIYHRHRQPAHRSIPSPEQAMWILLARSARLCSAGGGRGRAVIQKNQQQFNPRPARTAPAPVDGDTAVQSAASST